MADFPTPKESPFHAGIESACHALDATRRDDCTVDPDVPAGTYAAVSILPFFTWLQQMYGPIPNWDNYHTLPHVGGGSWSVDVRDDLGNYHGTIQLSVDAYGFVSFTVFGLFSAPNMNFHRNAEGDCPRQNIHGPYTIDTSTAPVPPGTFIL